MRFGAVSTITLLAAVGMLACAPKDLHTESTPGSGGATGGSSSGGSRSGGSTGSGGATGSGGTSSSGGSSTTQTGGSASGGALSDGGSSGRGGSSGDASIGDGALGGGGGGAGGSSSSTPCTDVVPPNQPSCADWKTWGNCSTSYTVDNGYCNKTCGRCSGGQAGSGGGGNAGSGGRGGAAGAAGSGGSSSGGTTGKGGSGGVTGPGTTNPQITGTNGFATRYWDCCKPSCSWNTGIPACQKDGTTRITDRNAKSGCDSGGSAFECYDFSPWYDAATNLAYGFAAKNGVSCGACFMLQFTGEGNSGPNAGAAALKGQQMVVQAINIGGIDSNQFDLLIPGGGVGLMTQGCTAQWGSSTDLGATYGGLLAACKGDANCMKGKCTSVFGNIPALKAGCDWFTGWFSSADNPKLVFKQVSCPPQITQKSGVSG